MTLMFVGTALSCAAPHEPAQESPAAAGAPAASPSNTTMPASLRAAYLQARQRDAGPEYAVQAGAAQVTAQNPAHHLQLSLDAQGVQVRQNQAAGSLRLVRAGCAERPEPVRPTAPRGRGARAEYVRPGLTEWYVNGPMGVEQGFTIARDPGCSRLALEVQLGGAWTAQLTGSGDRARVELQDRASGQKTYYSDLFAQDARGQELPTRLALVGQTIRLEVDAAKASYPIEVDPLIWSEQKKFIASDGAANEFFGVSVALSGDTAVIGAYYKMVGANAEQGQAYVFLRTGNTWAEQQKLVAADGAAQDYYGYAVAVSGDTAVVGAYYKKVGANPGQGKVYIYTRTGTTWTEQVKLTSADGAADDRFGFAVAADGDTVIVGAYNKTIAASPAQGKAYVYLRSSGSWVLQSNLTASDGASNEYFGYTVALHADTIVVGAYNKTVSGNPGQGKAYVYLRTTGTWNEQDRLLASDGAANDNFGAAVAVHADTAVVGARNKTVGTSAKQGQAYVFLRTGSAWSEQQKLISGDGAANDLFGFAVAVNGNLAAVGSYNKTVGGKTAQGQVYVYTRTMTTWSEQQKLTASDGEAGDGFGVAVAVNGDTVLVGAYQKAVGGNTQQGQAFAFTNRSPNGTQCTKATDCVTNFCVDGVCCDTACGNSDAADCQACSTGAGAPTDGTCANLPNTKVCRNAAGDCDLDAKCGGSSATCPANAFKPDTTVCRNAAGDCDLAAKCTGSNAVCPANGFKPNTTVCRNVMGDCDVAAQCTGSNATCPANGFKPNTTVCRNAAGDCDVAAKCAGDNAVCPANGFKPGNIICRAAAGDCDVAEQCSGSSATCPTDSFKSSTAMCRSAAGVCDVAAQCSGSSASCPANGFKPSNAICRVSTAPNDPDELCSGQTPECPPDVNNTGKGCTVAPFRAGGTPASGGPVFLLLLLSLLVLRSRGFLLRSR